MSNCGVGSGGFGLPQATLSRSMALSGQDRLAHDGNDDDFGLFVCGGEATVEDHESRIVSASAQSGHAEHITDWQPTTVDAATTFELSAFEIVRGETDEGGDLLAAHLTEPPATTR